MVVRVLGSSAGRAPRTGGSRREASVPWWWGLRCQNPLGWRHRREASARMVSARLSRPASRLGSWLAAERSPATQASRDWVHQMLSSFPDACLRFVPTLVDDVDRQVQRLISVSSRWSCRRRWRRG